MNFDYVLREFPGENQKNWHRHPCGGGWVRNTASVSEEAFVGEEVIIRRGKVRGGNIYGGIICGGTIHERASIHEGALIRGGEVYGGNIHHAEINDGKVYDGFLNGGCSINQGAIIYDGDIQGGKFFDSSIYRGTIIGGSFRNVEIIGGTFYSGEWHCSPLQMLAIHHFINVCSPGKVKIGYIEHEIEYWLSDFYKIAEGNFLRCHMNELFQVIKFISLLKNHPSVRGGVA